MTLFFENSYGEWRPIAECAEKIDAAIAIKQFLDSHNYKSYYTRMWESDGWLNYDVGSWSEFFHLQIDSNARIPVHDN